MNQASCSLVPITRGTSADEPARTERDLDLEQPIGAQLEELVSLFVGEAQLGEHLAAGDMGLVGVGELEGRAALDDGPVVQTSGLRS
jgi:hypothetical protein